MHGATTTTTTKKNLSYLETGWTNYNNVLQYKTKNQCFIENYNELSNIEIINLKINTEYERHNSIKTQLGKHANKYIRSAMI
jgi:hypothetical protein